MRCPKCRFVSSDKKDLCPKCQIDLRPYKKVIGVAISHPNASLADLIHELQTGALPGGGVTSLPSQNHLKKPAPAQSTERPKPSPVATAKPAEKRPVKPVAEIKSTTQRKTPPPPPKVEEEPIITLDLDDPPPPVESSAHAIEEELPDLFAAADELFEKITAPIEPIELDPVFEAVSKAPEKPPADALLVESNLEADPDEEELDRLFAKVIQSAQPTPVDPQLSIQSASSPAPTLEDQDEEMLFPASAQSFPASPPSSPPSPQNFPAPPRSVAPPQEQPSTLNSLAAVSAWIPAEGDSTHFLLTVPLDDESISESTTPLAALNTLAQEPLGENYELFIIQALLADEEIIESHSPFSAVASVDEPLNEPEIVHLFGAVYIDDEAERILESRIAEEQTERSPLATLQTIPPAESLGADPCILLCNLPIDEPEPIILEQEELSVALERLTIDELPPEQVASPEIPEEPLPAVAEIAVTEMVATEMVASAAPPAANPLDEELQTPFTSPIESVESELLQAAQSEDAAPPTIEEPGELRTSELLKMLGAGPKSATPEIMELSEEDLEAQLDELLTDEEINFTSVAMPRPAAPAPMRMDNDDDLEITFEVDIEGEESDGEQVEVAVEAAEPQSVVTLDQLLQMMAGEDSINEQPLAGDPGISATTDEIKRTLEELSHRSNLWLEADRELPPGTEAESFEISSLELYNGESNERTLLLFEVAQKELRSDAPLVQIEDVRVSEKKQLREKGFNDLVSSAVEFVKAEERGETISRKEDKETELHRASHSRRFVATVIDAIVALGIAAPICGFLFWDTLATPLPLMTPEAELIETLPLFAPALGCWIGSWCFLSVFLLFGRGQTVGQRVLGLLTVNQDGGVPGISQSVLRTLLNLGIPTGLLGISKLFGVTLESASGTSVRKLER